MFYDISISRHSTTRTAPPPLKTIFISFETGKAYALLCIIKNKTKTNKINDISIFNKDSQRQKL